MVCRHRRSRKTGSAADYRMVCHRPWTADSLRPGRSHRSCRRRDPARRYTRRAAAQSAAAYLTADENSRDENFRACRRWETAAE